MKFANRKYVTKSQIQKLELGQAVILNTSQLIDLSANAPTWVRINSVSDGAGFHVTSIQDTRNETHKGVTRLE